MAKGHKPLDEQFDEIQTHLNEKLPNNYEVKQYIHRAVPERWLEIVRTDWWWIFWSTTVVATVKDSWTTPGLFYVSPVGISTQEEGDLIRNIFETYNKESDAYTFEPSS